VIGWDTNTPTFEFDQYLGAPHKVGSGLSLQLGGAVSFRADDLQEEGFVLFTRGDWGKLQWRAPFYTWFNTRTGARRYAIPRGRLQFAVNKRWSVGGEITFNQGKTTSLSGGPMVQWRLKPTISLTVSSLFPLQGSLRQTRFVFGFFR
jgi:hypothetical protein